MVKPVRGITSYSEDEIHAKQKAVGSGRAAAGKGSGRGAAWGGRKMNGGWRGDSTAEGRVCGCLGDVC